MFFFCLHSRLEEKHSSWFQAKLMALICVEEDFNDSELCDVLDRAEAQASKRARHQIEDNSDIAGKTLAYCEPDKFLRTFDRIAKAATNNQLVITELPLSPGEQTHAAQSAVKRTPYSVGERGGAGGVAVGPGVNLENLPIIAHDTNQGRANPVVLQRRRQLPEERNGESRRNGQLAVFGKPMQQGQVQHGMQTETGHQNWRMTPHQPSVKQLMRPPLREINRLEGTANFSMGGVVDYSGPTSHSNGGQMVERQFLPMETAVLVGPSPQASANSWMANAPAVPDFKCFQRAALEILEPGDYTPIPGGKRFIKKSGWRKIACFAGISFEIKDRTINRDPNGMVQRAEFIVRAAMLNGRFADGWGSCDRHEKRFSKPNHDIPSTAETRAKSRACQDLLGIGEPKPER